MTRKPYQHIRQHAKRHHEEHARLKRVLNLPLYKEKILDIFVGTFFATLATLILFMNWGSITDFFNRPEAPTREWSTHGFQDGVLGVYRIAEQLKETEDQNVNRIVTSGALIGLEASRQIGKAEQEQARATQDAFKTSIQLTGTLSSGQHLTAFRQNQARGLQKSMLATFYLGEKTVDIDSTLDTDTRLLRQINNALSVGLFQHLNQANNRADTLSAYQNLLSTLLIKTNERLADLNAKISFLQENFSAQEERIGIAEETFFNSLEMFNGPNAEQELGRFIGLQGNQAETRAKLGAYQGLADYYLFFKPRLENLITAIKANRDALVAGVKVVEIQNMTLPLIIREH